MQTLEVMLETLREYDLKLFTLGDTEITLLGLLKVVVALVALFAFAAWLRAWMVRRLLAQTPLDQSTRFAIATLMRYTVIVLGIVMIMQTAGINLSSLTLLAGAIGVGVGFGLQDIVKNFVSGLIIMFDRPVRIGDRVEIGGVEGEVIDIGARRVTLLTPGNVAVIVPNSKLITDNVKNMQRFGHAGMVRIALNVSRDSDPRAIETLLYELARETAGVLEDPPPYVRVMAPTAAMLPFELDMWTDFKGREREALRNNLHLRLNEQLRERGIELV